MMPSWVSYILLSVVVVLLVGSVALLALPTEKAQFLEDVTFKQLFVGFALTVSACLTLVVWSVWRVPPENRAYLALAGLFGSTAAALGATRFIVPKLRYEAIDGKPSLVSVEPGGIGLAELAAIVVFVLAAVACVLFLNLFKLLFRWLEAYEKVNTFASSGCLPESPDTRFVSRVIALGTGVLNSLKQWLGTPQPTQAAPPVIPSPAPPATVATTGTGVGGEPSKVTPEVDSSTSRSSLGEGT